MEDLRIYFATYNVGTSNPDESLLEMLSLSSNPKHDKSLVDFYVIGLQEVSAQPHHLVMDALYDDPWTRALKEILSTRGYIKVKTIRLQGLVLSVFVLQRHLLNVREVESNYTRTGLSGMWGNKGAVSIRLGIYGCTLCFVNAHLSAHDGQLSDRIEDYNSIVREQEFHVPGNDKIFFHDYVFWLGDLNFRLMEEYEKTPEEIERSIERGELETLFNYDQLRYVMNKRDAFAELNENKPTFPPTFKFEVGESKYDHKRRPAWCDRILYKVHHNNYENVKLGAEQKSYVSHPRYTLSDHKPVTAEFVVKANFNCLDTYETYEYVHKNASPTPQPKFQHAPGDKCSDQACRCTRRSSSSRKYDITFSQPKGKLGLYRLVYISETEDKVRSVLGISEPFPLKVKDE